MKRSTLFNFCLGSFIAAPLLLLSLLLYFQWESIESKVAANANGSLAAEHAWATAETFNRGRDVLIVGTAPNQGAADDALNTALSATGVRTVSFGGNISPVLAPARLNFSFEPNSIVLRGALGSHAQINNLVATATNSFSPRKIVNQLAVVENIAASPDLTSVFEPSKALSNGSTLAVTGTTLTVSGEMPDEQSSQSLIQQLSENYEGEVVNKLRFTPAESVIPCQVKVNEILATSKINFKVDESTITQSSFPLLNNLADILRNCPAASVQVIGHTDYRVGLRPNQLLSEQRATSVVKFFIESGLETARFEVIGKGAEAPIADNRTAAGRAANRRIEFRLKI